MEIKTSNTAFKDPLKTNTIHVIFFLRESMAYEIDNIWIFSSLINPTLWVPHPRPTAILPAKDKMKFQHATPRKKQ